MTDIMSLTGSDVNERAIAKAALDAAEEQLRSLCAAHASTFVAVERRGQAVQVALKDLLKNIESSEEKIEAAKESLEQEDEEGEGTLAALSEKHRVRRRTLLQHSHLLELLELPSLMDACVRSNLYDDALSIAAFSNILERRHTEKNPVVVQVIEQIRSRQADLRRHLLHSLKSYVTMPQCLEIVTALRRLNSIDLERQAESSLERTHNVMELSLQVDFLEARDVWLDKPNSSDASGIMRGNEISVNASEHLLDAVERYRTRVFEIATQFNAIFRTQTNQKDNSISLLSMWTSRKVESFLDMLSAQLDEMKDSAQLRDALDACVFFSASMGRLGADFTPQLPSMFEKKMHSIIKQCWKEGVLQLAETLKICREAGAASPLISSSHVHDNTLPPPRSAGSSVMDGPPLPPRQLMAYPPLARVLNSFLTGMNELRRCLLPGVFKPLRDSLNTALTKVASILQSNERAVLTPGLRGDAAQLRKIASEMRAMFSDIMDPYLRSGLEFALGNDVGGTEFYKQIKFGENEVVEDETADEVKEVEAPSDDGNDMTDDTPEPKEVEGESTAEESSLVPANEGTEEATEITPESPGALASTEPVEPKEEDASTQSEPSV